MADKFNTNILRTEQPKKNFTIPTPGFQTKPTVIIGNAALQVARKVFINTTIEAEDQEIGRSRIFNQPIYSDITFAAGSYTDQNNLTQNYALLNVEDVLITVMNTKNIIKTTLQGRNGTVKEYISDGDFTIKIEGRIYGQGMTNYPENEVQKLLDICLVPQSINVTSSFLKLFNVEDIVIESYNVDQVEGVRNYQPFTLNCVSDTPLILLKNA
jgi:hypothetical protein